MCGILPSKAVCEAKDIPSESQLMFSAGRKANTNHEFIGMSHTKFKFQVQKQLSNPS